MKVVLPIMTVALVIAYGIIWYWQRGECRHLSRWEMAPDCEESLHSRCDWTPACKALLDDAESRELNEDLHLMLRGRRSP